MKLIYTKTELPVKPGDIVNGPCATKLTVVDWEEPPSQSDHPGYVYTTGPDGAQRYYPRVFGMRWLQ